MSYKHSLTLILLISLLFNSSYAQNPQKFWQQYKHVEEAGFSKEKLEIAKKYYDSLNSSAFMIIKSGKVVAAWGAVDRRFILHSTRKGILSSLYGIYTENGTIDLNTTIGALGITDKDSLSDLEKSAKIIHLLKVRSGVYHKAAAEPSWVDDYRPQRNSVQPDSLWFYNNWDFNVLGTIFEQHTATSIYKALYNDIAIPLEMQDYRIMDGTYYYELAYSNHPAYHLKMSARDLARYGQLFLQQGVWNGNQIFSKEWVANSTFPTSKHGGGDKIGRWYGWLWGVSEYYSNHKMYFASGTGGQIVAIFPRADLVLVNLCNTYEKDKINSNETITLFDLVLNANIGDSSSSPQLIQLKSASRIPNNLQLPKLDYANYIGEYAIDNKAVSIIELNGDLILNDYYMKLKLLPISPERFFVEDIEKYLIVELNEKGQAQRLMYED